MFEEVEKRLDKVDRHIALQNICNQITLEARTEYDKHLALIEFMQRVSYHGKSMPMYPDRKSVFDPLILLELTEMSCGQIARLGVDLWTAGGGKGRLFSVGHHVSAEIYYDGKWHLLEGDLWENGFTPKNPDGSIPSLSELSLTPYAIDSAPPQNFKPINPHYTSREYIS